MRRHRFLRICFGWIRRVVLISCTERWALPFTPGVFVATSKQTHYVIATSASSIPTINDPSTQWWFVFVMWASFTTKPRWASRNGSHFTTDPVKVRI